MKIKGNGIVYLHDEKGYWEVRYMAPRGLRVNRRFDSVTVDSSGSSMWFDHVEKIWKKHEECKNSYSTHHNLWEGAPRTFKAFLRYLKKHSELKGHQVILVNRMYYSFDDGTKYDTHVIATYIKD